METCTYVGRSQQAVDTHVRFKHKKEICEQCGKEFQNIQCLNLHRFDNFILRLGPSIYILFLFTLNDILLQNLSFINFSLGKSTTYQRRQIVFIAKFVEEHIELKTKGTNMS